MKTDNLGRPITTISPYCGITELLALREYHIMLVNKHEGDDARVKRDRTIIHHIDAELFTMTNHILQIDNFGQKL